MATTPERHRKRSISDLLNEDSAYGQQATTSEPPTSRARLDDDGKMGSTTRDSPSTRVSYQPSRDELSGTIPDERKPTAAFLPYPNLASHKPKSIPFQQPSQLLSFSYTPQHVQEFTDSAMRYFVDPPIGANLSYGYDRWIRKTDDKGRIDALLKAVSRVRNDPGRFGPLPEIGVVSWRGVITKILTAPYETYDGWELNVMSVNGTMYFEEHISDAKLQDKNNMDPRQRSQTYHGYAFESFCTSDQPMASGSRGLISADGDAPYGWGGDVDTNVQWCSVVRTKLGDKRMIIGGEVDCVRGKYTGKTDTFVELKTSLAIRGHYDRTKFEKKLLKFYVQSFLLGVPEVVVGFRTPAGVVTTVESFKTIEIPRLVRGKPGAWDPLVCLDWAHQALNFIKERIERERGHAENKMDDRVWRVKFVPGSGLTVELLDRSGVEEVVGGEDRVGFVPRWYWDEMRREEEPNPSPRVEGYQAKEMSATGAFTGAIGSSGWKV